VGFRQGHGDGGLPGVGRRFVRQSRSSLSGCIIVDSSALVLLGMTPVATRSLAGDRTGPDGAPTEGSVRFRCRRRRRLLLSVSAVFVAFLAGSLALFVYPSTDQPRHVDGILSLNGGDETARESEAVSLAENGVAPVLLFSRGSLANDTPCPKVPRVSVVCFVDVTDNTRGEARWAAHYAERHHWHSLLIVPGRAQATRARLLVERCFSGQVVVTPATESLREIPGDVFHEWGGLFAALLIYRGC
jgi:hypothetical protein